MAGERPTALGPRRRRVPYEWILGAMFVGTFAIGRNPPLSEWMDFYIGRGIWLVVIGPMAGVALGVRRRPDDPRPRFGLLLLTAALGWLWCASIYLLMEAKSQATSAGSYEALRRAIGYLLRAWPYAALLGFTAQGLAAVRPGRYREFAVFANAAFLLVLAWGYDLFMSPKS